MGKRISAKQWGILKRQFPELVKSSHSVRLDFQSNLFKASYRRYLNKKRKPPVMNDVLSEILSWCEEMLNDEFYVESSTDFDSYRGSWHTNRKSATFYFSDDNDVILFKLCWMNSNGLKDTN